MKKGLLHTLILTCKEATLLIEKREAGKISFVERIRLKAHLLMCEACRLYEKQSKIIEKVLRKVSSKKNKEKLDEAVKQKIIEKIQS
ncbi:MAG: hypothetical protein OHK0045_03430 [Raineya sp.]